MEPAISLLLAATVCVAAVTDLLSARIPNWLTLPMAALAILLHATSGGATGLWTSLAGLLTGFALLIGLYALGGTGAGDVKLLATVGAFVGPQRVISIFLYTAMLGGIYALGIVVYSLIAKAGWAGTGRRLRAEGTTLFLTGGDVQPLAATLRSYPKLRYAIVIALGLGAEQIFGPLRF